MTVGERIKEVREKTGMSQVDFADKINVSKQTLYKYENNLITNIPSDKIEAVAKVGGVSPAYLMGWDNRKTFSEIISENIKTYRQSYGASQSDVAEYIGVSKKDIDDFERGVRSPSLEEILNLANAFNISADKLLSLPEDTDRDIQELFIVNKFNENNYKVFKVHVSGKDQICVSDGEVYYEIDIETFDSFMGSINNYIAFNIKLMLSKATPIYYKSKKTDIPILNAAHHSKGEFTDEERQEDEDMLD